MAPAPRLSVLDQPPVRPVAFASTIGFARLSLNSRTGGAH